MVPAFKKAPVNWFLAATLLLVGLVGCDGKEKELQEQIDLLTTEITQLDSQKQELALELDSVASSKEQLAVDYADLEEINEDFRNKLNAVNSRLVAVNRQNAALQQEINQWKQKAETLAAENEQLREQITALQNKVAAAEERAAAAERHAEEAEAKYQALLARMNNTYFVQSINVRGFAGGDEFAKEKIKPRADELRIAVQIGRPEGVTASGSMNLVINILTPDNQAFYSAPITIANDQGEITVDIKGNELDLDVGKYTVVVSDDGVEKFKSFFLVAR